MGPNRQTQPGKSNPLALATIGLELGLVTAAFCLGGWWLDQKLKTEPWLLIVGAFVGIVGGIYNTWRKGQRFFKKQNRPH